MKFLIDDKRSKLPDGSEPDIIARTYQAGLAVMNLLTSYDELYVDHDLGDGNPDATGYRILTLLEEDIVSGFVPDNGIPHKIICVSDNGPGRYRINQVIDSIRRLA